MCPKTRRKFLTVGVEYRYKLYSYKAEVPETNWSRFVLEFGYAVVALSHASPYIRLIYLA